MMINIREAMISNLKELRENALRDLEITLECIKGYEKTLDEEYNQLVCAYCNGVYRLDFMCPIRDEKDNIHWQCGNCTTILIEGEK